MVSQVERYYPRTRRAVGPVSQTDRFYDDTRNDVRCPYADELGGLEELKGHVDRRDNPHGVTAGQVGAVPLLGPGEAADAATHGKTALVTQNGTSGGFAVSGQAGAGPDAEDYITHYQRDAITVKDAPGVAPKTYKLSAPGVNEPETVAQVQDISNRLDVHNANAAAHQAMQDALKQHVSANYAAKAHAHANYLDVTKGGEVTGADGVGVRRLALMDPKGQGMVFDIKASTSGRGIEITPWNPSARSLTLTVKDSNGSANVQAFKVDASGIYENGTLLNMKYAPREHTHADLAAKEHNHDSAYLKLSGGTINGNLKFSKEQDELWVSTIKSFVGTPIYDVTFNKGFNFLSIYQLTGYLGSGQRGKVFFTQENATTNWIDVTTLKEGGTPIADKYAAKADVYTKKEVDTLIAQAVANAKTQLLEQLKTLYAPLSSVQATINGQTYRWAYSETYGTFAMQAVEA